MYMSIIMENVLGARSRFTQNLTGVRQTCCPRNTRLLLYLDDNSQPQARRHTLLDQVPQACFHLSSQPGSAWDHAVHLWPVGQKHR